MIIRIPNHHEIIDKLPSQISKSDTLLNLDFFQSSLINSTHVNAIILIMFEIYLE